MMKPAMIYVDQRETKLDMPKRKHHKRYGGIILRTKALLDVIALETWSKTKNEIKHLLRSVIAF